MTTITIQNKAEISAEGKHVGRNGKPVICIDTGEKFASCSDAANAYNVHLGTMSNACNGKLKTCKGKRFCYLAQVSEHIDTILDNYAKANAKANEFDKIQAEREAARREEELREKAALKRAKAIEKAKANVARRQQILENDEKRIQESQRRLTVAIRELSELEAIVNEY